MIYYELKQQQHLEAKEKSLKECAQALCTERDRFELRPSSIQTSKRFNCNLGGCCFGEVVVINYYK